MLKSSLVGFISWLQLFSSQKFSAISLSRVHPNLNVMAILYNTEQPQQTLKDKSNLTLLRIIRDNLSTQYVAQASSFASFRAAIAAHGAMDIDTTLLADFRVHVPLSNYDSYKPFIEKFNVRPCRKDDVENMFSPGLPDLLVLSSGTSGATPKMYPKYNHCARLNLPPLPLFDPSQKTIAVVMGTGYRDVKEIECSPGEVIQKIPVCVMSGGTIRRSVGWYTDDESRLSATIPGFAVPWAATVVGHLPSFLILHGLFFLVRRDLDGFYVPFATMFIDLIRHIDAHWDMLISCIRDGILPDLKNIGHVRKYLEQQLTANPDRAAELHEIGSPFSLEGWFARVWPNVKELKTVCSGQFATVFPKVKFVLGPNIPIRSYGYGASEAMLGLPHRNTLDEFVLRSDDIVEFLDISQEETHQNLFQAWEVVVGKQYEPVLTTKDGLWRYQLGDILSIIGFDDSGSPVFKFTGRRSLTIRLRNMQITSEELLAVVQAISSEGTIQVQEFTSVLDNRMLLPTVGFLIEPAGSLGPDAHLAPQKLFDAFVSINAEHQQALSHGMTRLPTIRIVKMGTFAEYRQWKAQTADIAPGQIKVPLVLLDPTAQKWISERVVKEL